MKIFVFISCFSFFLSQPVRPSVISLGDFLVVHAVLACRCVVQLLWSDCVTWLPVYWWQTMMTLSSVRAGGSHRRRTGPGNKIWCIWQILEFSLFVDLMTPKDTWEKEDQDDVVLIVFDMRMLCEEDKWENASEKQSVKIVPRVVVRSETEEIMSIKTWSVIIETLWDQSPLSR